MLDGAPPPWASAARGAFPDSDGRADGRDRRCLVGERPLLFDLLRPLLEEESDDEGRDREKDLARSE